MPTGRSGMRRGRWIGPMLCAFGLWSRTAATQPAKRPVILEVIPGSPEIDAEALQGRISAELGVRVVSSSSEAGGAAVGTLVVGIDRATREIVVEFRRQDASTLVRRLPLPTDPGTLVPTLVFLAGNMARDESRDLIRDLAIREASSHLAGSSGEAIPNQEKPQAQPVARRYWIGLGVEGAVASVPSTPAACSANSTTSGTSGAFACTTPEGAAIADEPSHSPIVDGGSVRAGSAWASPRFAFSFDYALDDNWLLGSRFGIAVNRYPGGVAKSLGRTLGEVHLEARATYVLGERPLARSGVRLAATIAAGMGEWDTRTSVAISAGSPPSHFLVDAWRIHAGPFISAALGPRISLGLQSALRVNIVKVTAVDGIASGTGLTLVFTPEIGGEIGF